MPTQNERTAVAKGALIDAAADLVIRGGFSAASVAEIGRKAGMSRGAVNYHFTTKQRLFLEVIEQQRSAWEADLRDELPMSVDGAFDALFTLWVAKPIRASVMLALVYEARGPSSVMRPAVKELIAVPHHFVRARIVELQVLGLVRPSIDAEATAQFVTAALLGIAADAALEGKASAHGSLQQLRSALVMRLNSSS